MRKFLFIFLSVLLISCTFRSDYYTLNVDGYKFTVGYDDVEYLRSTFVLDLKEQLEPYETVENIEVTLFDELFCVVDISNNSKNTIDSKDGTISKLTIYLNDVGQRTYMLNEQELDSSVTSNCNKFNGTLIERNGYACVIEKSDTGNLNVVELHGDILNKDQDRLDHIIVYLK